MVTFQKVFELLQLDVEIKNGAHNCPFHEDRLPSCFFDFNHGLYHCFSCGRKGNAVKFFIEYNKIFNGIVYDYNKAKRLLEGTVDLETKHLTVEFTEAVRISPKGELPFYLKYEGLDRIKAIQGIAIADEDGLKWYLD